MAAKQQGLEVRPHCLFSAPAHREQEAGRVQLCEISVAVSYCAERSNCLMMEFVPVGISGECPGPLQHPPALWPSGWQQTALLQLCASSTHLKLPVQSRGSFMDYLGCCFGEILGDELACTLRCQLELNSGQILSQNYFAFLSKSPHRRLSQ